MNTDTPPDAAVKAPAGRRALGIPERGLISLFFGWIPLLGRIHELTVRFVVPPGVAKVGGLHIGARVDMTNHALAGRDSARKSVANRMAGLIFRDRSI